MLQRVDADSLDDLINKTIPENIRRKKPLRLPPEKSESEFLRSFKEKIRTNQVFKSYIGLGYYNCHVPSVIQRNILENPGWYTAYTPYQAEIAQGRLEALVNFQTMVMDLTGMEIANASLLDEGTAAAEAMSMFFSLRKGSKKTAKTFFVDANVYPQTLDILKSRAKPLGIQLHVDDYANTNLKDNDIFGAYLQFPDNHGKISDPRAFINWANQHSILVCAGADLLSLTLLKPPGEMGADAVVGNSQRFGVPLGYGGPHAGYFATKEEFRRQIPGRIIGASVDDAGNNAYRMALQTREQHIRREKATSNICTAQVLLAVIAGMYAVYHGAEGLRNIARKVNYLTKKLRAGLISIGLTEINEHFFDTLKIAIKSPSLTEKIKEGAVSRQINFRYFSDDAIGISLDETTDEEDIKEILELFSHALAKEVNETEANSEVSWPSSLSRKSGFLTHPVFSLHRSEHQILRYLKKLENKDLSLVHSMIPLGSCTMKLNATTEMLPISWPEINQIHPYAPTWQTPGYQLLIKELSRWLSEITGFADTSLQPNSGAQGEYSGLMVIRAYHENRGDHHRNLALIPSSAHGTNPASAIMAGMKVVIVKCDDHGNIDVEDLKAKAEENKEHLSALMITYPSTHGVFEEDIVKICDTVHENGGQVYMDGANMNAQVGLTSPAAVGADVCHLNLHKTFCIPHGGGGPGVGPICVAKHLKPFLPGNPIIATGGEKAIPAISAAPWGSASILSITYAYIRMMGPKGLTDATKVAILNANYLKNRLEGSYKILYTGKNGRCAHEFIIDCREFKNAGIGVEDIAKRLMDYGFHAPTISFPVPGTMMIEPTESEALDELDRFCAALIQIRKEIEEIETGIADRENNVLKNAPHTVEMGLSDSWNYPYTREKAVYPLPFVKENKFWPSVRRIDNAYGDRNLICSCIPLEDYEKQDAVLS